MTENEKRERCAQLLAQVPDSGLDDVLETLQDALGFWKEREAITTHLVSLQPASSLKQVTVRIGKTTVRPEFPIVPDEYAYPREREGGE